MKRSCPFFGNSLIFLLLSNCRCYKPIPIILQPLFKGLKRNLTFLTEVTLLAAFC